MIGKNFLLWEDSHFVVKTPFNPHLAYQEGVHLIVAPKLEVATAWQDPELTGKAFELAAKVCSVLDQLEINPWFNLQANGNWGLLEGQQTFFHIHIYGRNRTQNWGKPVALPELPGTYMNEPMPAGDMKRIMNALTESL